MTELKEILRKNYGITPNTVEMYDSIVKAMEEACALGREMEIKKNELR